MRPSIKNLNKYFKTKWYGTKSLPFLDSGKEFNMFSFRIFKGKLVMLTNPVITRYGKATGHRIVNILKLREGQVGKYDLNITACHKAHINDLDILPDCFRIKSIYLSQIDVIKHILKTKRHCNIYEIE